MVALVLVIVCLALGAAGQDCLHASRGCDEPAAALVGPSGAWCYNVGIGVSLKISCAAANEGSLQVETCADSACSQGCIKNNELKQELGLSQWDGRLQGQGQCLDGLSFGHTLPGLSIDGGSLRVQCGQCAEEPPPAPAPQEGDAALAVTKTVSRDTLCPNQGASARLVILNTGASPADGIVIVDTLAPGLLVRSNTPMTIQGALGECHWTQNVLVCRFAGYLLPSRSIEITYGFRASANVRADVILSYAAVAYSESPRISASHSVPISVSSCGQGGGESASLEPTFPPVAFADEFTSSQNTPFSRSVVANDTTYGAAFEVILESGIPSQQGVLILNSDGVFTLAPVATFTGIMTFQYRACNSLGCSENTLVTIRITATVADNPIANNDVYVVTPGSLIVDSKPVALQGDVTRNDQASQSNPQGPGLTPIPNNTFLVTLLSAPTNPSLGSVILYPDGSFFFYPENVDSRGQVTFQYILCETVGRRGCSVAMVTIDLISPFSRPIAVSNYYSTIEGVAISGVSVTENDASSSGVTPIPAGTFVVTIISAPSPDIGTVSLLTDGALTFTPNLSTSGRTTFTYELCESVPEFGCSTTQVTIDVVRIDQRPVARVDVFFTPQRRELIGTVVLNDTSSSSNPLGPAQTPPPENSFFVELLVGPNSGTLVLNQNGVFRYTPALNFNGTVVFRYRLCETVGDKLCDETFVNIRVGGIFDYPIVRADYYASFSLTPIVNRVNLNDTSSAANSLGPNTTPVPPGSYIAQVISSPALGSLDFAPDGTFGYIPTMAGVYYFDYQICELVGDLLCAQAEVTLDVRDQRLPIARDDVYEIIPGGAFSRNVTLNDTSSDGVQPPQPFTFTVNIVVEPSCGTAVMQSDGSFFFAAPQTASICSFTYELCELDRDTGCDTAIVTINVAPPATTESRTLSTIESTTSSTDISTTGTTVPSTTTAKETTLSTTESTTLSTTESTTTTSTSETTTSATTLPPTTTEAPVEYCLNLTSPCQPSDSVENYDRNGSYCYEMSGPPAATLSISIRCTSDGQAVTTYACDSSNCNAGCLENTEWADILNLTSLDASGAGQCSPGPLAIPGLPSESQFQCVPCSSSTTSLTTSSTETSTSSSVAPTTSTSTTIETLTSTLGTTTPEPSTSSAQPSSTPAITDWCLVVTQPCGSSPVTRIDSDGKWCFQSETDGVKDSVSFQFGCNEYNFTQFLCLDQDCAGACFPIARLPLNLTGPDGNLNTLDGMLFPPGVCSPPSPNTILPGLEVASQLVCVPSSGPCVNVPGTVTTTSSFSTVSTTEETTTGTTSVPTTNPTTTDSTTESTTSTTSSTDSTSAPTTDSTTESTASTSTTTATTILSTTAPTSDSTTASSTTVTTSTLSPGTTSRVSSTASSTSSAAPTSTPGCGLQVFDSCSSPVGNQTNSGGFWCVPTRTGQSLKITCDSGANLRIEQCTGIDCDGTCVRDEQADTIENGLWGAYTFASPGVCNTADTPLAGFEPNHLVVCSALCAGATALEAAAAPAQAQPTIIASEPIMDCPGRMRCEIQVTTDAPLVSIYIEALSGGGATITPSAPNLGNTSDKCRSYVDLPNMVALQSDGIWNSSEIKGAFFSELNELSAVSPPALKIFNLVFDAVTGSEFVAGLVTVTTDSQVIYTSSFNCTQEPPDYCLVALDGCLPDAGPPLQTEAFCVQARRLGSIPLPIWYKFSCNSTGSGFLVEQCSISLSPCCSDPRDVGCTCVPDSLSSDLVGLPDLSGDGICTSDTPVDAIPDIPIPSQVFCAIGCPEPPPPIDYCMSMMTPCDPTEDQSSPGTRTDDGGVCFVLDPGASNFAVLYECSQDGTGAIPFLCAGSADCSSGCVASPELAFALTIGGLDTTAPNGTCWPPAGARTLGIPRNTTVVCDECRNVTTTVETSATDSSTTTSSSSSGTTVASTTDSSTTESSSSTSSTNASTTSSTSGSSTTTSDIGTTSTSTSSGPVTTATTSTTTSDIGTTSTSTSSGPVTTATTTATTSTAATTTPSITDLKITKDDCMDTVAPSQVGRFNITVENQGPTDARSVTITDVFPVDYAVLSFSGVCSVVGRTVTCELGTLVSGASSLVEVEYQVRSDVPVGTIVTNCALLTFAEPNNNALNSEDCDSNTIVAATTSGTTSTTAATTTPQTVSTASTTQTTQPTFTTQSTQPTQPTFTTQSTQPTQPTGTTTTQRTFSTTTRSTFPTQSTTSTVSTAPTTPFTFSTLSSTSGTSGVVTTTTPGTGCIPPANDNVANAFPLFDGMTAFSTLCATTSSDMHCFDDGADIFFRYLANVTGLLEIDTCSNATDFDTTLVALTLAGQVVECGDDFCNAKSKITVAIEAGQELILRVAGFRRATGMGILNVQSSNSTCPPWPGPSVCPLTYNASCMTINFVFEGLIEGFGAQGCECGPAFVPARCQPPPVVPLPPCPAPPTAPTKCLTFNFQFGSLLAAADPRTPEIVYTNRTVDE